MERLPLDEIHSRAGARFREARGYRLPADYGDPAGEVRAAAESAALFDLSFRGRIAVVGPDRIEFLHGQASNEVRGLKAGEGTYATFLTGKGKMRGDAWIWRRDDEFLLDCEAEVLPLLLAHLRGFVIMEDVALEDRTPATVELGVHGPEARKALEEALAIDVPADLPEHGFVRRAVDGGDVLVAHQRPTGVPGYEVVADASSGPALWRRLSARVRPAGIDAFEVRRIESAIPRFGAEMDENTIPIEAGLHHAVSYTKGCYTGNEVILRLKTYGHVNRKVVALAVAGSQVPMPGDAVLRPAPAEDGGSEKIVGQVTSAAASPRRGTLALAMVRAESAAPGTRLVVERKSEGTPERLEATVLAEPDGRNG